MEIELNKISLEFKRFLDRPTTLKEGFVRFITNFGKKSYVSSSFTVLDDISFKLQSGDRLAIIGRNGSGKTSLLRLIAGIYKPTAGKIKIKGKIHSLIEIGAGFNPELTGRENIYICSLIQQIPIEDIRNKEQEIIDFSGIGEAIDQQAKYYSTGMHLRLSLAIALNISPEILLVDELFAGGDVEFIKRAEKKIEDVKSKARIFIAAPHNMDYVTKHCNKVLYLSDNQIRYFGDDLRCGIDMYLNNS